MWNIKFSFVFIFVWFSTGNSLTFSVFCKSKTDRTLNIVSQSELIQKVLDVFPVNGKSVTASNPRVLMQGFDETGYQVTSISFKLRTKKEARSLCSSAAPMIVMSEMTR